MLHYVQLPGSHIFRSPVAFACEVEHYYFGTSSKLKYSRHSLSQRAKLTMHEN